MRRARRPSAQTAILLTAFAAQAGSWRYGYDLSRETGLAFGTLYPILVRLNKAGLLDAEWRNAPETGRPARHVYRLTAHGLALARELATAEAETGSPLPAGAPA